MSWLQINLFSIQVLQKYGQKEEELGLQPEEVTDVKPSDSEVSDNEQSLNAPSGGSVSNDDSNAGVEINLSL